MPELRRFAPLSGALFFALLLSLGSCERDSAHAMMQYTEEDTQVERGREVEILYSDSAVVRIRVRAATMLNYTDRTNPRQEFPDGVQVDFLDAKQKVTSTLTAKTAVRDQEKGLITMRQDVLLVTAEKEKLETEELIWDERTARARTDKFVKVTKPGEILYGLGLEASQDFSYWKILVPKGRVKTDQIDEALDQ